MYNDSSLNVSVQFIAGNFHFEMGVSFKQINLQISSSFSLGTKSRYPGCRFLSFQVNKA